MKFLPITLIVHGPGPITGENAIAPVLNRAIPDPPWPAHATELAGLAA